MMQFHYFYVQKIMVCFFLLETPEARISTKLSIIISIIMIIM